MKKLMYSTAILLAAICLVAFTPPKASNDVAYTNLTDAYDSGELARVAASFVQYATSHNTPDKGTWEQLNKTITNGNGVVGNLKTLEGILDNY